MGNRTEDWRSDGCPVAGLLRSEIKRASATAEIKIGIAYQKISRPVIMPTRRCIDESCWIIVPDTLG